MNRLEQPRQHAATLVALWAEADDGTEREMIGGVIAELTAGRCQGIAELAERSLASTRPQESA